MCCRSLNVAPLILLQIRFAKPRAGIQTGSKRAQRFFLYGAAKEFEADFGVIDRILDYMIAMEAALVPERDHGGRLLRERAMVLLHETAEAKRVMKKFYDVRSDIAHGASVGEERIAFLKERMGEMES